MDANVRGDRKQALAVCKEVRNNVERARTGKETAVSYDEKPGIQTIESMAFDLAPEKQRIYRVSHPCP